MMCTLKCTKNITKIATKTPHFSTFVGVGSKGAEVANLNDNRGLKEMKALGLEPRTYGLKGRCSTS